MTAIQLAGDCLRVQGPLTLDSVPGLWRETPPQALAGVRQIDLGGVGDCDSAGLALLLAWIGGCGSRPRISHLPDTLRALARVSNAVDLLQPPDPTD